MRYYKQSLKYEDKRLAEKWLKEYVALGGNRIGMARNLKAAQPLGGLTRGELAAFYEWLSPEEGVLFEGANDWYARTYLPQD